MSDLGFKVLLLCVFGGMAVVVHGGGIGVTATLSNECIDEAVRALSIVNDGMVAEFGESEGILKPLLKNARKDFEEVMKLTAEASAVEWVGVREGMRILRISFCDQKSMYEQGNCIEYLFRESEPNRFTLSLSREHWHIGRGKTRVYCD